jgi:hypothetical protein
MAKYKVLLNGKITTDTDSRQAAHFAYAEALGESQAIFDKKGNHKSVVEFHSEPDDMIASAIFEISDLKRKKSVAEDNVINLNK